MNSARNKTTGPASDGDISVRLNAMQSQRRKVIQSIFDHPREYVLLSLRQMARKLGQDPSTLLRTIRALGFKHYRDFRTYLHNRVVTFATSLEAMEQRGRSRRAGVAGLIEESIERDAENIRQLRSSLDPARVIAVAKRISGARKVLILAGDMVASLGRYFEYTLSMVRANVVIAVTPGEMVHRVRFVGKQDVVIAITHRRGLRQTVEAFESASKAGAYCVGISGGSLSPLVSFSDDFFVTPIDCVSFADSYAAGMAFINAMLVAVTNQRRSATTELLKKIAEEQRTGERFYFKEQAADFSKK
jgi:DNA-binding MurR/RpiR family transcriptional regulator